VASVDVFRVFALPIGLAVKTGAVMVQKSISTSQRREIFVRFYFFVLVITLGGGFSGCASDKSASDKSASQASGRAKSSTTASAQSSPQTARASFSRPGGKVALEFGDDGHWLSISSVASAPVSGSSQASVEQATTVATLKARRNLAEFMGGELQSSRSLRIISRGVQRAQSGGGSQQVSEVSSDEDIDGRAEATVETSHEKIAQTVRETVTQRSAAILKGVMTTRESHDRESGIVTVEIMASQRSIDAARSIRQEMER